MVCVMKLSHKMEIRNCDL